MIKSGKIIIYPNAERDDGFDVARKVSDILRKRNRETALCPMIGDYNAAGVSGAGLGMRALEDELPFAEMIITIGGDGTMLHAARTASVFGIPILGINTGAKGFMAELEAEDIGLIDYVADGIYETEDRMMIDAAVLRNGKEVYRDFALNDIVVRGDNKVIDLTLYGDNQKITQFSGDGAVVATPTGSTAYSMAAGGPIVEPLARNIIVTPICAHVLEARSLVLVSDRRVTVEIGYKKNNPAYLSADGGKHTDLQCGDIVNVQKSKIITQFIRITDRSFYQRVSEKLGER